MRKKYILSILKKTSCLLALVFFTVSYGFAQGRTITGNVTDSDGQGLPGVNVILKGTTSGNVTDVEGNYSLADVKSEDVLVFSMVGFTTEEISVGNQSVIDIALTQNITALEEIVVIGYGESNKRDLTGSTGSAPVDDMLKAPVASFDQALAGRVAGVQVSSSEGRPGTAANIKIRGSSSITQSSAPLYVVDGFPMEDFDPSSIDPTDIEAMEILKGPSAVAIYGARGGNGVVLITTRSGVNGKVQVSYNGFYGVQDITTRLDVMSVAEFVDLQYEVDPVNAERQYGPIDSYFKPDGTSIDGIDWQNEVYRQSAVQSHTISINGGTDATNYNLSMSLYDAGGLIENSGFNRKYVKLKLDQKVTKKLRAGANVSYTSSQTDGAYTSTNILNLRGTGSSSRFNLLKDIVQGRPTGGLFYTNQDLLTAPEDPDTDTGAPTTNPLVNARALEKHDINNQLLLNGYLNFEIMKGLDFRINAGLQRIDRRLEAFNHENSATERRNGYTNGLIENITRNVANFAGYVTYKETFGTNHDLTALLGGEYQDITELSVTASGQDFPEAHNGLDDLGSAGVQQSASERDPTNRVTSLFGRVNYAYADKYLFTATVRRDGSSKFGPANKYGIFPSFSGAWRFSDESFVKNSGIFSDGKLRMEWGQVGNNRIPAFQSQAVLSSAAYGLNNGKVPAISPDNFANPDLKWETQEQINIGLDMGFIENRLTVTADLYRKDSKDLLLEAPIPSSTGFNTVFKNIGSIRNEGVELAISSVNINKAFKWTTDFNITSFRTETLALAESDTLFSTSEWDARASSSDYVNDYISIVGRPFGQMYGYVDNGLYGPSDFDENGDAYVTVSFQGVDEELGFRKYVDMNGDSTINDEDKVVLGSSVPDFFGGMTNNFSYKGFDLSIFFRWSYGNEVYNANRANFTSYLKNVRNFVPEVVDRWRTDRTPEENEGATFRSIDDNTRTLTSQYIEDASYIRLQVLSLGYTFPENWVSKIKAQNIRVYVTGQNLYTWTNYTGYDPEVSTRGDGLTAGVDYGAYPRAKVFIGGISITF